MLFAAMAVALAEKAVPVLLIIASRDQPWAETYRASVLLDDTITFSCILSFLQPLRPPPSLGA